MKKAFALILALCLVFSMVACSSAAPEAAKPENSESAKQTEAKEEVSGSEKVKLRLVSISTDDNQTAILENYIKKNIAEALPNIEVEFEPGGGGEDMSNKLKTYNSTGDLPDVWYSTADYAFPIIGAGNQLDLASYIAADGFIDNYNVPEALEFRNGTIYTLPSGADTYFVPRVFFNKAIFEENNIEIPTTFEELLDVCDKLNDAGIVPISLVGKGGWAPQLFLVQTFIQLIDPTVAEQLLRNETDFSNPVCLEAVQKIEELVHAGAFPEGVANLDYGPALEMFTSGRSAMYWGFTWEVNNLGADENVDIMQWPALSDNVDPTTVTQLWGSPLNGYAVNAKSEHLEEAIQLAEFCVKMEALYYAENGSSTNLNPGIEAAGQSALMQKHLAMYDAATTKINAIYLNAMDGSVGAEYGLLGANLLTGDYSAENYIADMNAAWAENEYFN